MGDVLRSPARTARPGFGTVATALAWSVVLPLMNVLIPLFFQVWAKVSLISFFGEQPSPGQIAAEEWKLFIASGVSLMGTVLVLIAIVDLKKRGQGLTNLWVAVSLSALLSAIWLAINGGWLSPSH